MGDYNTVERTTREEPSRCVKLLQYIYIEFCLFYRYIT